MMEFKSGLSHFEEVTLNSALGRCHCSNTFFKFTAQGVSFNIRAESDLSLLDKTYKAFKVVPLLPVRENTPALVKVNYINFLNEKRTLIDTLQQFSDMQLVLLARQDEVSHASQL